MVCTICGKKIPEQKFRHTCDECEEKVDELSQEILKSRQKLTLRHIRQADVEYSEA